MLKRLLLPAALLFAIAPFAVAAEQAKEIKGVSFALFLR